MSNAWSPSKDAFIKSGVNLVKKSTEKWVHQCQRAGAMNPIKFQGDDMGNARVSIAAILLMGITLGLGTRHLGLVESSFVGLPRTQPSIAERLSLLERSTIMSFSYSRPLDCALSHSTSMPLLYKWTF